MHFHTLSGVMLSKWATISSNMKSKLDHNKKTGPRLNIKTVFPRYGDSHIKYKTYTGKTVSLYWDGHLISWKWYLIFTGMFMCRLYINQMVSSYYLPEKWRTAHTVVILGWFIISWRKSDLNKIEIDFGIPLFAIRSEMVESAQMYLTLKNIDRHTAHTIVSWPNPKQWIIDHTSDLMMIIRQSVYSLNHKGIG